MFCNKAIKKWLYCRMTIHRFYFRFYGLYIIGIPTTPNVNVFVISDYLAVVKFPLNVVLSVEEIKRLLPSRVISNSENAHSLHRVYQVISSLRVIRCIRLR